MIKATSVEDRIMILRGGTGSGKSVTLGPEFYIRFQEATMRNIAVTQPRILTAMGIPETIVNIFPDMVMGDTIGYQTGQFVYKPTKGVVFMTIGTLAQQLKTMSDEEFMEKYAFVIIDECHERSLDMDLTLSLSKQFIHRNFKNRDCPFLILTSATFDVDKYAKYFGVGEKNIIDVAGLNYEIVPHFPKVASANYVKQAASLAIGIHTDNDYSENGDILIFVYGGLPIAEIRTILDAANEHMQNHFVTIGLTGMSSNKGDMDYQNIFKPLSSINVVLKNGKIVTPRRRIIISTNVAETGVTIDTLKYLIDTGYENSLIFNPIYGSTSLLKKAVTKASALQRKGRVGRKFPGVWYPMYTREIFDSMQVDKFPELISRGISNTLLGLIIKAVHPDWDGIVAEDIPKTGKFRVDNIDLMDYPAVDSISYSLEKLYILGMINGNYAPTVIGLSTALVMKIDMELIRMVLAGYMHGANVLDLITVAAFMYVSKRDYIDTRSKNKYTYGTTFERNEGELEYYDKLFIADDFIETIFIWEDFMDQIEIMKKKLSIRHVKKWCLDHGLVYDGLLKVIDIRDGIISSFVQSVGLDPYYNGMDMPRNQYSIRKIFQTNVYMGIGEVKKIKKCIYEGFRLNTATWDEQRNTYILDTCHEKIKIKSNVITPLPTHKTFLQSRPKKIVVRNIDLNKSRFNESYQFECDRVSVMDGFVDIDETFNVS